MWFNSDSGKLTFKDAYIQSNPTGPMVSWAKLIWKSCIPPSKSFIIWRILQNRMPTDDILKARGCIVVTICSLCGNAAETTDHLFLGYPFAQQIWICLSSVIGCSIDYSSFLNVFSVCRKSWCT